MCVLYCLLLRQPQPEIKKVTLRASVCKQQSDTLIGELSQNSPMSRGYFLTSSFIFPMSG